MDRHCSTKIVPTRCRTIAGLALFLAVGVTAPMACAPGSRDPEARARSVVRRFDGEIARDSAEEGAPIGRVDLAARPFADAHLESLASLTGLHHLVLRGTLVTDAVLARLKAIHRLRVLDLGDDRITDAGLAHLADLTSLRGLYLSGTQVTDAGLRELRPLRKLRELGLGHTGITDAGLVHLAGLEELRVLDLRGTRVSGAGLSQLKGLTRLQRLHVSGLGGEGAGARELQLALPSLKILR
jgi:hypothetical protein